MPSTSQAPKPAGRPPLDDIKGLQTALRSWFGEVAKDYPWRRTEDPYEVLVSEMMLQQTQVATVLGKGYYRRWLERFPDVQTLAVAQEEEVLRIWEGLGYYSRARNLQKAAKAVVEEHGGVFPREVAAIEALPGVGRYTAGAVASFAYDQAVPAVDANIARVLARWFDFNERIDTTGGQRQLWEWAAQLVPADGGRDWNSAVMELGQTTCRAKSVACEECPAAAWCLCADPLVLPMKKPRAKITEVDEHVLVARCDGKILLEQETGRRRQGMWKLPAREPADLKGIQSSGQQRYGITRYKVTMHLYETAQAKAGENEQWFRLNEVADLPMPSPYRRAISSYLNQSTEPTEEK